MARPIWHALNLFGIDFEDTKRMFYLVTSVLVFFALICYCAGAFQVRQNPDGYPRQ